MTTKSIDEQETRTAEATDERRDDGTTPGKIVELDIQDPDFMATAHETYAKLRAEGPVSRVRLGKEEDLKDANERRRDFARETYFVSRYDDVVEALLDDRFSVDPASQMTPEQREQQPETPEEFRPLSRSILTMDPPDHTRVRKLVQPSFTGRAMEALRGSIQETVDNLLDEAERAAAERGETAPNRQMELVSAFAYPFPVTVISDLLGLPREDREQIRGWTENLLRVDRGRQEEEIREGLLEFIAYLKDLFERKRREPTDDMITQLVHAEEDGDVLNEDEMLGMVFILYLAGHVTTVNLVGNGVVALLTHPEELVKVRADPSLVKNAVEETLRYWGPVDFVVRRMAKEDIEIDDTVIRKGKTASIGLASANRDPERFERPDDFDITRPDFNRHVAFGKGIHVCLGAPLARMEGQVAFETLLRRYPDLRLAVPEEEIRWSGSFLRGFRQVPLLF